MQLVLDIGNTRTKLGLYDQDQLVSTDHDKIYDHLDAVDVVAYSSVGQTSQQEEVLKLLEQKFGTVLDPHRLKYFGLDRHTALNFKNGYKTPDTLGLDRIALVAGALGYLHANKIETSVLVLDLGTCITADAAELIGDEFFYQGGAISPGWQMRLNAMHQLTARLPKLENDIFFGNEKPSFIGQTTAECMHSGAFWGVIGELNYLISMYFMAYKSLTIMISGGDAPNFASLLTYDVVLKPHLVLDGINQLYLSSLRA